jgi:hypothetical protein
MKHALLISFFTLCCSSFLLSQNSGKSVNNIKIHSAVVSDADSKEETQTVTFHVNDPLNAPVEGAGIGIWPAVNKARTMERMVKEPEKTTLPRKVSGVINDTILIAKENPDPTTQPLHRLDNIGQWIQWHTGQNTGAVSLTFGGILNIASRWTPEDLIPYEGMTITHLELYIQDLPISVTAKIWQGTSQDNLVQVLSQPLNDINSNSWHVLELYSPYTINAAEELWFGFVINDPGTPDELIAGRDNQTSYDGKGNKLKIDNEEWKNLSEFGVDGNWNISAFVVPVDPIILYTDTNGQASFDASSGNYSFVVDKDGYSAFNSSFTVDEGDKDIYVTLNEDTGFYVTFNVDMTDVEEFNPSEHIVYLTGSFNNWLTPGESGSIQMNPVVKENYNSSSARYNDKSIIYTRTLHLEPGEYQYKYFSDAVGDGWDGGEWPGTPDRSVFINESKEIFDVWGVYEAVYFSLFLQANPAEGGSVSGQGQYGAGDIVELTAVATDGYELLNWVDEYGNILSNNESFTYTMPPVDITLTAFFVPVGPEQFEISFSVKDQNNNPLQNAMISIITNVDSRGNYTRMKRNVEKESQQNPVLPKKEEQLFAVSKNSQPSEISNFTSDKSGSWMTWDDSYNSNSIGLLNEGSFYAGSRWTPDDLQPYAGKAITKLKVFINDIPNNIALKIWQGPDMNNMSELYSQPLNTISDYEWYIVDFLFPFPIDTTQELMFGYMVDDPGEGVYPAGVDGGPAVAWKGDLIKHQDGWTSMSLEYNLDFNWNLQAFVENIEIIVLYTNDQGYASFTAPEGNYSYTVEKEGYLPVSDNFSVSNNDVNVDIIMIEDSGLPLVTFNVDMTEVIGFDPGEHSVYLTGSFTGWAEPGTIGSLEMSLITGGDSDSPPFNFFDNFDGYEDFTTDLTPWTTYMINTGNTWESADFDFPGEGTAFAFMAFNPSMTTPPINYDHPAVSGSRYLVAIQSQTPNDDKWLISPEFSFHESSQLSFIAKSITDGYGMERIRVLVSTTGMETSDFTQISAGDFLEVPTDWSEFSFDLSAFAGETGYIAIQYVSYDAFIFMLDAFSVTSGVDTLIYTTTLELASGQHQYKYFSDAYGDGWEGGEWPGPPDRNVVIHNDTVVNDTWGVLEQDDLVGFILPYPNQIYEVGVDEIVPIQILTQLNYNGEYWLYAEINDEWHYVLYSDFEGPGIFDHEFIIPDAIPSGEHKFILDYHFYDMEEYYYAESNSFTIINNNPGLEVVSPQSMDAWLAGNTYEIRWNSVNISLVNIHYSLDNGDTWELIASHVASDNGYNSWGNNSFFWQIPQEIEGNYNQSIIRIENVSSPSAVAFSDVFTILNSPIVFNKPLPGQVYEVGVDDVIPIEIEMLDDTNAYYYLYVIDGDRSLIFQGYFSGTDIHTYDFIIPETLTTGEYYFYLDFSFGGSSGNIQSNSFTIINENSAIEVEQPGSGDFWVANHNQYISWNSVNISNVNIYYSLDNGESWNMIVESAPSYEGYYIDGYNNYLWQIPDDISDVNEQSLIRVEDATDPSVFGISELFTLSGPLTNIIHPDAETVIAAGQELQIEVSVLQSSWISLYLGDEDENWHYINGAFSNTGLFSYNYTDTQWISPGTYRLIVEHSETGSYEYGEYFNILPAGTQFNVTFNIEMSAVPGFDPNEHKVYLTGSFADWATPGTDGSVEMVLADYGILTYSAELSIDPGQTQYKYFSDLFGQGWSGSEWAGEPNRNIQVSGNMHTNDEWGVHPEVFFQLQLISNPENGGSLAGAGYYNAGTNIEISSIAHSGFEFISWEDAHGNIISIESDFEYVTPPLNWALTANFELILYTLTLQVNPEEGGSVTGAGDYAEGHDVTVMADPNEGYIFLYWKDEHGNELTNNSEYDFNMPDDDTTLIAYFELGSMLNEISYNDINLYPNPAEGYVIIISDIEIQEVQISDITGKIVYSETIKDQEKQIAVDYFDPGMYFVRIYTQQGVIVEKLQVNR